MNLKTKLFVLIGLLLLITALAMYLIPSYFIKKDVYTVEEQIRKLVAEDQRGLIQNQASWMRGEIQDLQDNLNAILLVLQDEKNFAEQLKQDPWRTATRLASFDPEIGFIQVHSPEKSVVLVPNQAILHSIRQILNRKGTTWIILDYPEGANEAEYIYLASPIDSLSRDKTNHDHYVLAHPDVHMGLESEVEAIKSTLKEKGSPSQKKLPSQPYYDVQLWADKIDMISLFVSLFSDNSSIKPMPDGLASVNRATGSGQVLLSREVFQTSLLFDDQAYFHAHSPKQGLPQVAAGFALVKNGTQEDLYIVKTLLFDSTYLSIGAPLERLVQKLAQVSHQPVLLEQNNKFILGYDRTGARIQLGQIVKDAQNQEYGHLTLDSSSYYYNSVQPFDYLNLKLYSLYSVDKFNKLSQVLRTLEKKLSEKISLQVFLVTLGGMAVILFFVSRLVLGIIRELRKLAVAAEAVGAGNFGDIQLPEVKKRKDEIATLTNAFSGMVKGLQERETIRGVLNKVVSKDIADEILRSQIHLGGEDRIVTMLFSDIRDFTKISENLPPQKIIEMLNTCMTKMSRVIETEGGLIDKFVGDEIMALYGAPTSHPDHALRAISSALLMIETLKKWNIERKRANEAPIEMGIGIHTGLVVAGNMGAEDRLNYTVLGANVNLAARLCSIAGPNIVIISENTLKEPNIENSFYVKPLEPILPKGFSEYVKIYQVIGFKWDEVQ